MIFFHKKANIAFLLLHFTILFSAFLFSSTAFSQTFGVTKGSSISEYNPKPTKTKNLYFITPPNPHPAFEAYTAIATPKTGICTVIGIGVTINNDSYGTATKSTFEDISNQLKSKYGNSKMFDFLRPGSIWNEPKEWTTALFKKERSLARFWDAKEHSTLPSDIESIGLTAYALSDSDSFIKVRFEFNNVEECDSIIKKDQSSAF